MDEDVIEFSRKLLVSDIPVDGMELDLRASDEELALLAHRFGVVKVLSFTAHIAASRWRRDGVKISGSFQAEVEQICVSSLEPMVSRIEDEFAVRFVREKPAQGDDMREIQVEAVEDEDEPELLSGEAIDVGDLAAEYAVLAVDPYPRREDAPALDDLLRATSSQGAEDDDNPFASLAELRKELDER